MEDEPRLLGDLTDSLAFIHRECQRLFTIDVLSRPQRVDRDLDVPVIRRADRDHVDVLALQQLAIVLVDFNLGVVLFGEEPSVPQVHVRHGDHVADRTSLVTNDSAATCVFAFTRVPVRVNACPNGSHVQLVVGGVLSGKGTGYEVGNGKSCAAGGGHTLEKVTATGLLAGHCKLLVRG